MKQIWLTFIIMTLVGFITNCNQKKDIHENFEGSSLEHLSDTVKIYIDSIRFYSELKDDVQSIICVKKIPAICLEKDNENVLFFPINLCHSSGEIVDIRKHNVLTISSDSIRTAKQSNPIDSLKVELDRSSSNYGNNPFLPSSPNDMVVAINLKATDSSETIKKILVELNNHSTEKLNILLK